MVVAGLAKAQMTETFATAIEKKDLPAIESEPMCYLLSKLGYADDSNKRWLFHLRFFYLGNRPRNRGGEQICLVLPSLAGTTFWSPLVALVIAVQRGSDGTEFREGSPLAHHPQYLDARQTLEHNVGPPSDCTRDP